LIRLQPNNIRDYWEQLQAELKSGNLELETWALRPREGRFYARAASDRIFIEGKGVKGIRSIAFPEFEKVAKYYNDYIDDVLGIKQRIRDEVGYNTQYILTLIHHVLEKPEVSHPEVDTETPERAEHERSRRSKNRW